MDSYFPEVWLPSLGVVHSCFKWITLPRKKTPLGTNYLSAAFFMGSINGQIELRMMPIGFSNHS